MIHHLKTELYFYSLPVQQVGEKANLKSSESISVLCRILSLSYYYIPWFLCYRSLSNKWLRLLQLQCNQITVMSKGHN